MYIHIGHGKYWKLLYYSSIAGLIGATLENSTIAYICQKSQKENYTIVVPFFIAEIFWIICEYSIPYLNLIKIKAIVTPKTVIIIKWFIENRCVGNSFNLSFMLVADHSDDLNQSTRYYITSKDSSIIEAIKKHIPAVIKTPLLSNKEVLPCNPTYIDVIPDGKLLLDDDNKAVLVVKGIYGRDLFFKAITAALKMEEEEK